MDFIGKFVWMVR